MKKSLTQHFAYWCIRTLTLRRTKSAVAALRKIGQPLYLLTGETVDLGFEDQHSDHLQFLGAAELLELAEASLSQLTKLLTEIT